MLHDMNVGGTEKSFLTLLSVLPQEKYDVTVLLLEKFGAYLNLLPKWVNVEYVKGFSSMKNIIMDPPLQTIKYTLKKGRVLKALRLSIVYLKAKLSNNWIHFYKDVLKAYPKLEGYDTAVAYAGPSDFISYFIADKVN